jgi:hypothetical protein
VRATFTDGSYEVVVVGEDIVIVVGEPGPPGQSGGTPGAGSAFTHVQASPSTTWLIVHNLGYRPNVYSTDNVNEIVGEVIHSSVNTLTVSFDTAVAGRADLS